MDNLKFDLKTATRIEEAYENKFGEKVPLERIILSTSSARVLVLVIKELLGLKDDDDAISKIEAFLGETNAKGELNEHSDLFKLIIKAAQKAGFFPRGADLDQEETETQTTPPQVKTK